MAAVRAGVSQTGRGRWYRLKIGGWRRRESGLRLALERARARARAETRVGVSLEARARV